MKARKRIEYGRYIVADPEICHGKLTFKGTRVLVADVLHMLAKGKSWDWISNGFHGLPQEAIAEAIRLAGEALNEKFVPVLTVPSKQRARKTSKRIEFGNYIVSDPEICGGELTFKGTRMFVKDVLYLLAKGYDWNGICREFYDRINHEAIVEAIELAQQALAENGLKRKRAA